MGDHHGLDVQRERSEVIVRAFKSAWRMVEQLDTVPATTRDIALYLLGVAGRTEDAILAYNFAEFAAFFGGLAEGEFDDMECVRLRRRSGLRSPTSDTELAGSTGHEHGGSASDRALRPPTDWDAVPLPPGIMVGALTDAFTAVQHDLTWVVFGDSGGPAWARVVFTLRFSPATYLKPMQWAVEKAAPEPRLDLAEVKAVSRLPHPPPTAIQRRGYLLPSDKG